MEQRYLIQLAFTRNPKRAIRAVGLKTHEPAAQRLMKGEGLQAALAELEKAEAAYESVTPDRVEKELAAIAFANMADFALVDQETGGLRFDFRDVPRSAFAAVKDLDQDTVFRPTAEMGSETREFIGTDFEYARVLSTKVKLHDKLGALAALIKLKGYEGRSEDSDPQSSALRIKAFIEKAMAQDAVLPG